MTLPDLQQAVKLGQDALAQRLFREMLQQPYTPLPEAYCEASIAEYRLHNLKTAQVYAQAAEALLQRQPNADLILLSRLRLNLMAFCRELGNIPESIAAGHRWLDELGDNALTEYRKGRVFYNLALAYRQRGGPNDAKTALDYYTLAADHFDRQRLGHPDQAEREISAVYQVMAIHNKAWLLCELAELPAAQEQIEHAQSIPHGERKSLVCEQTLLQALITYKSGDPSAALQRLGTLPTELDFSPRQQFWISWLAARAYYDTHQYDRANVRAAMAVDEAARTNERFIIRLADELHKTISPGSK